jgi:hypothetical protein
MENEYESSLTVLKKISRKYRSAKGLVRAADKEFNLLGSGSFRHMYATPDEKWVFKLQRYEEQDDSGFGLEDISKSNAAEAESFENLLVDYPSLSAFCLAPSYHVLPNGHDVIFMPKVSMYAKLGYTYQENMPALEQAQIEIIRMYLPDSHENNIGYTQESWGKRFYLFDLNWGCISEESDEGNREAAKVLKRIDRLTSNF